MRYAAMILGASMSLAACDPSRPDASRPADVASDLYPSGGKVYLYRVDAAKMVRTTCPADAVVVDSSTCDSERKAVPLAYIYSRVTHDAKETVEETEKRALDLAIEVQRTERRLLEIMTVASSADPATAAALQKKIDDATRDLTTATRVFAELRRQIKLLEEEIAHAADADALMQLDLLQGKLNAQIAVVNAARDDLGRLRDEWIEAVGSVDDQQLFDDLAAQRAEFAAAWTAANVDHEAALAKLALIDRTFKLIAYEGFVYRMLAGNALYAKERAVFQLIARTFSFYTEINGAHEYSKSEDVVMSGSCTSASCRYSLSLPVEEGERLLFLQCFAINGEIGEICTDFTIRSPAGRRWAAIPTTEAPEIVWALGDEEGPDTKGLELEPPRGTWQSNAQCAREDDSTPLPRFHCRIQTSRF